MGPTKAGQRFGLTDCLQLEMDFEIEVSRSGGIVILELCVFESKSDYECVVCDKVKCGGCGGQISAVRGGWGEYAGRE